jgi:hypothetical protein
MSNFEEIFLFLGTIGSLVTAPVVCLIYGEIVPIVTLSGITFFGWAGGNALYRYNRNSSECLHLGLETIPAKPKRKAVNRKKASTRRKNANRKRGADRKKAA